MSSDMERHTVLTNAAVYPEQVRKAQLAAARNATDPEELVEFLGMLGIHPDQPDRLHIRQ